MEIIIILIVVLIIAGIANGIKGGKRRELIQNTGQRVSARVTNVAKKQDYRMHGREYGVFYDYYEITAEWTDPYTHQKYILKSGERVGHPRYRKGDLISAYVSPQHGSYLEI